MDEGKRKKRLNKFIAVIVIALVMAGILIYKITFLYYQRTIFQVTDQVLYNPFTGFAPAADYIEAVGENTLVYVDVTWREWEPEEGQYDIDSIWANNYLSRWKSEGKHVVLRFLCDLPSEESHRDIPDWLYEKTQDGTEYNTEYGKGYSPDYTNQIFIHAHDKAIRALGNAFGKDDFVAYVQLGSLGHWGEWHVKYDEGIKRFPGEDVYTQYVLPYLEVFPNARIMMRRPFQIKASYDFGLFNDMTGDESDTKEWLDWISSGGTYEEAEEIIPLTAEPQIWNRAPIGGEFTSGIPMETMLGPEINRTISLIQDSHMTFIGPKCPRYHKENQSYPDATELIQKNIGYRFGISKSRIVYDKLFHRGCICITVQNTGVAPMYQAWPMYLYYLDENRNMLKKQQLDLDTSELTGSSQTEIKTYFDLMNVTGEKLYIAIGIEDPETSKPVVKLDMKCESENNIYFLSCIE